nr:hypothetical protein CFP56_21750 [Quercus suber]
MLDRSGISHCRGHAMKLPIQPKRNQYPAGRLVGITRSLRASLWLSGRSPDHGKLSLSFTSVQYRSNRGSDSKIREVRSEGAPFVQSTSVHCMRLLTVWGNRMTYKMSGGHDAKSTRPEQSSCFDVDKRYELRRSSSVPEAAAGIMVVSKDEEIKCNRAINPFRLLCEACHGSEHQYRGRLVESADLAQA